MAWFDVRGGNRLKSMLREGTTPVGAFIRIPAIEVVELAAHAGCDFVILDTEHTPVGWERLASMVVAADASSTVPIVRVPTAARDMISRVLDAGAHGVMVPQVETAEQAATAVAATRYGPDGTRGAAGNRRMGYGMRMTYPEYVPAANEAVVTIIQVETRAGVDAIEAILGVERIDCIFIGLTDLSVDFGVAGAYDHPDVEAAVDAVLEACRTRGVPVGVPVSGADMATRYTDRGVGLVAGSDMGVLGPALRGFVEGVRPSSG